MRVLLVHTFYQQGGGEDQVFKNELALLSSSIQVESYCFYNTGNSFTTSFKFFFAFYNVLSARKIKQLIKFKKPDLIHIHNWYFTASPAIIHSAKKSGIPVVQTLHNFRLLCPSGSLYHKGGIFLESVRETFPWKAVKLGVYRHSVFQSFWLAFTVYFHKLLGTWKSVDKYIALTPHARKIFLTSNLHLSSEQITVKPNFVQDNGCTIKGRNGHFLFVGRLTEEKGIEVLIKAFCKTAVKLIIIGDGPLGEMVEKAALIYPNLTFLGKKDTKFILSEMKIASALIFPSKWYEGMPMTILEAFSTGTPIIASRLGAMETLVNDGENGILFEPGNENDLLIKVLKWSTLRQEEKELYCIKARETYEMEFTAENNLRQLLSIYQDLLKLKTES